MVSTVTNLADYLAGAPPAISTVFGDRTVGDGNHDGYRMDFGMWLDCHHCWGLEADYFDVSGRPDNYDSGLSNGYLNGNLFPLVRAYYDPGINPNTASPTARNSARLAFRRNMSGG